MTGFKAKKVTGRILTSPKVQDHNTFDDPTKVVPEIFNDASISKGSVKVNMPPNSVIVLELMINGRAWSMEHGAWSKEHGVRRTKLIEKTKSPL